MQSPCVSGATGLLHREKSLVSSTKHASSSEVRRLSFPNESSEPLVALTVRTPTLELDHRDHRHLKQPHPDQKKKQLLVQLDSCSDGSWWSSVTPCAQVDSAQAVSGIIYGVINSILTIPAMYGYAAIIFSHATFASFMPTLSKLVMFSSVVHQIMFTSLSSLPFAIGQVQDAGLIFLSAMATSICNGLGDQVPVEAKVATTVVALGIATASLGVCLVVLGKLRLASLVSYLPMPVVGGYLAFIGLFCLFAGVSLSTGMVVNDIVTFTKVLLHWDTFLLSMPGIIGGWFLLWVCRNYASNAFALPAAIVALPLVFYLAMYVAGHDMPEMRAMGWVSPQAPNDAANASSLLDESPPSLLHNFIALFELFDLAQVHWHQLLLQIPTWLGMVFVVAFSSCLDVAAIEMDMGKRLDINHELGVVGWSNVVSGVCGGFTGSYIFSQTIFTFRSFANKTKIVGVIVIFSEFALVLAPINVLEWLPRFFFAATLIFIAIDLLHEWLFAVATKILLREYIVLWSCFIAINATSLEIGMLIGIGVACLNFLFGYAQIQVMQQVYRVSSATRHYAARNFLATKQNQIVLLQLNGFLFFGSSVQILEEFQNAVVIEKEHAVVHQPRNAPARRQNQEHVPLLLHPHHDPSMHDLTRDPVRRNSAVLLRSPWANARAHRDSSFRANEEASALAHAELGEVEIELLNGQPARQRYGLPTKFVVLDFSRVSGMDATAARSSFLILFQLCRAHAIRLYFANVLPEIRQVLQKNVFDDNENDPLDATATATPWVRATTVEDDLDDHHHHQYHNDDEFTQSTLEDGFFFENVDFALEYCENELLRPFFVAQNPPGPGGGWWGHAAAAPTPRPTLELILNRFIGEADESDFFMGVEQFFVRRTLPKRDVVVYHAGDQADSFYVLASGKVVFFLEQDDHKLVEPVIPGAMFGEVDFFGRLARSVGAKALQTSVVFEMTRVKYEELEVRNPVLFQRLRELVIHSLTMTIFHFNAIKHANALQQ